MVMNNACAYLTMTSQNACCEKGLLDASLKDTLTTSFCLRQRGVMDCIVLKLVSYILSASIFLYFL